MSSSTPVSRQWSPSEGAVSICVCFTAVLLYSLNGEFHADPQLTKCPHVLWILLFCFHPGTPAMRLLVSVCYVLQLVFHSLLSIFTLLSGKTRRLNGMLHVPVGPFMSIHLLLLTSALVFQGFDVFWKIHPIWKVRTFLFFYIVKLCLGSLFWNSWSGNDLNWPINPKHCHWY